MKTKVVKEYRYDGTLLREYEVLEDKPDIKHGMYYSYYEDGETVFCEATIINGEQHGETKFYTPNGSYGYSSWWYENKWLGKNKKSQEKFKQLTFLDNCKRLGI